jgi:hypothetical protein
MNRRGHWSKLYNCINKQIKVNAMVAAIPNAMPPTQLIRASYFSGFLNFKTTSWGEV